MNMVLKRGNNLLFIDMFLCKGSKFVAHRVFFTSKIFQESIMAVQSFCHSLPRAFSKVVKK